MSSGPLGGNWGTATGTPPVGRRPCSGLECLGQLLGRMSYWPDEVILAGAIAVDPERVLRFFLRPGCRTDPALFRIVLEVCRGIWEIGVLFFEFWLGCVAAIDVSAPRIWLAPDRRLASNLSPPEPFIRARTLLTAAPPACVPCPAGTAG